MTGKISISWPRILAEGVAIVTSILLAFAINAWWERRGDNEQAKELLSDLLGEFQANEIQVERKIAQNTRLQSGAKNLLDAVVVADVGSVIQTDMRSLVGSVVAPSYDPITSTIDRAIETGQIDLIEDDQLKQDLIAWRRYLPDTAEDEVALRAVGTEHLMPELSKQVRFGRYLNLQSVVSDSVPEELVELRATLELEADLALRVYFGDDVINQLVGVAELQRDILTSLESYTAPE